MSNRHPEIIIASWRQAEKLLNTPSLGTEIRQVISIGDPTEPPPVGLEERKLRLRLRFEDVIEDTAWARGPTREDVQAIIGFARRVEAAEGKLLIHCSAGISRSSAAALIVLATWLGAGRETEAAERVFAISPDADPNPRMVEYADELLGRGGALTRATENRSPWY
jgi:predicted protein tyrosine phosphatase